MFYGIKVMHARTNIMALLNVLKWRTVDEALLCCKCTINMI